MKLFDKLPAFNHGVDWSIRLRYINGWYHSEAGAHHVVPLEALSQSMLHEVVYRTVRSDLLRDLHEVGS